MLILLLNNYYSFLKIYEKNLLINKLIIKRTNNLKNYTLYQIYLL